MNSQTKKAYLAGFLDGDGSIYVRLKPNKTYRFGFQIAPYIVLFQSYKHQESFQKICSLIQTGNLRVRNDGIMEYSIGKEEAIREFLTMVRPFVILKQEQATLMLKILKKKESIRNVKDFQALADLVEKFRSMNYSKKRKKRIITP